MKELEMWSISQLQRSLRQSEKSIGSRIYRAQGAKNNGENRFGFIQRAVGFAGCLLILLLISSFTAFAQSSFRVEGAGVEASPTAYSGACPGVIKFSGKIQANGKGRVKYTWLRNDGATAPVEYIDFTEAGVKYVSTTWTLGDARVLPNYSGWQQLKILSPNEYLSNKAEFKLTCKQANNPNEQSKPDLIIESAKLNLGEVCRERSPVLYATVQVKNIGAATSAARSDVGLVSAMDSTGSGWGNGVGLRALAPGESAVVTVPIYYLIADPAYMPGIHKFDIQVNSGSWLAEANTGNNSYGPVSIEIPKGFCGKK